MGALIESGLLQESKKTELNTKITASRVGVTELTSSIDGMRGIRDEKLKAIKGTVCCICYGKGTVCRCMLRQRYGMLSYVTDKVGKKWSKSFDSCPQNNVFRYFAPI